MEWGDLSPLWYKSANKLAHSKEVFMSVILYSGFYELLNRRVRGMASLLIGFEDGLNILCRLI